MFVGITRWMFALMLSLGGLACASEETEHKMSMEAPVLFSIPLPGGIEIPFSNSMVMLFLGVLFVSLVVRLATWKMTLIPGRFQNFVEVFFETLYNFVSNLLGSRMTRKYFWYFGSIFTIILCCNYMGLLPGVGIITYTNDAGQAVPLFRGANADMNVTLFLGLFFAVMWLVWCIREQGVKHFLLHVFGPKGGMKGIMGFLLIPIFFFVGLIDSLSIALRPIILGFRLYGNVYAGESVIEIMSMKGNALQGALCVLPFMFMELLIGFVQALVFLLLTVVFLKMQVGDEGDNQHAKPAP